MAAFLIDPHAKTMTDVEPGFDEQIPFLDTMRQLLGATQLTIMGLAGGNLAVVLDNFGMLKREQAYWQFVGGGSRVAGKAVMFAVHPGNGALAPIREEAYDDLRAGIEFCDDDISLIRVEEVILTEAGSVPVIARVPVFSDNPEPDVLKEINALARTVAPMDMGDGDQPEINGQAPPEASIVDTGWVVQASKAGGVKATRYRLQDGILTPAEMRTAKDLEGLRKLMPPGMKRVDPSDEEPEDVLELWVETGEAA